MTSGIEIGTKFTSHNTPDSIQTIVEITASRVIYNDGQTHFCGPTNRKQANAWFSIKGFQKRVAAGSLVIIESGN